MIVKVLSRLSRKNIKDVAYLLGLFVATTTTHTTGYIRGVRAFPRYWSTFTPPSPTSRSFVMDRPRRSLGKAQVVDSVPSSSTTSLFLESTRKGSTTKSKAAPVTPSPSRKRKTPTASSPTTTRSSPSKTVSSEDENSSSSSSVWTKKAVQAINPDQPYIDLGVSPRELRPSATLTTGQSFVWKAVVDEDMDQNESVGTTGRGTSVSAWGSHDATEWIGVIRVQADLSIVMAIKETPTTTLFRPLSPYPSDLDLKSLLWEYFQLKYSLIDLYDSWSQADPRLATIAKCIPGVRILDQDPFECLMSFICSSNNNIPRITKMVDAIRREYGKPLLTTMDGSPETLYSFPSVETMLDNATDEGLRQRCGLGYRSKYVMETLQILKEKGGELYLQELRDISDPLEVQTKLCEFCGVGRKVADCTALFSLRQDDAIPVDVHVWNIARRDYDDDGQLAQIKSLTPTTYKQVGDVFRHRFPKKAGWAHSLLFVAELPSFRPVLPDDILQEMDDFQREEKQRKKDMKEKKQQRQQ